MKYFRGEISGGDSDCISFYPKSKKKEKENNEFIKKDEMKIK